MIYLQMIESEDDKVRFEEIYLKYKSLMFYAANKILHNEQDWTIVNKVDTKKENIKEKVKF